MVGVSTEASWESLHVNSAVEKVFFAVSSPAQPLACLLEQFDGTCGPAAQAFLQQNGLYFLAHPDQFPDDRSKIIFMLTNLSGDTAKWLNHSTNGFNIYFLDPEHKGKAQKALGIKQSGNVESYTQQFNVQAYNFAWSDNILVSLYCGGLKENI
ncbi:uncharacterized protein VP01_10462g1 [Puccinia sorghi]|uniref:Uncharacterized protein n=1 Tax=Puccinia sorghi TaxID=27349 RepID=A0A0L6VU98_9BASI|nr:uncharacterized protein VP01_10462g1 [Puccinia sorghi]